MLRSNVEIEARPKHPILRGALVGAGLFMAGEALTRAGDKVGVSIRHGRSNSTRRIAMFTEHPIVSAVGLVTAVPVAEELLWRQIPSRLSERFPGRQKAITVGAAALFAAQHAGPDGIPLRQGLDGLAFEKLRRHYGLRAAIAAHSIHNGLAIIKHLRQQER